LAQLCASSEAHSLAECLSLMFRERLRATLRARWSSRAVRLTDETLPWSMEFSSAIRWLDGCCGLCLRYVQA
jgi:hypothetical protein